MPHYGWAPRIHPPPFCDYSGTKGSRCMHADNREFIPFFCGVFYVWRFYEVDIKYLHGRRVKAVCGRTKSKPRKEAATYPSLTVQTVHFQVFRKVVNSVPGQRVSRSNACDSYDLQILSSVRAQVVCPPNCSARGQAVLISPPPDCSPS